MSSGEAVIATYGHNKEEDVCLDEGAEYKHLCILETEFARALAKGVGG